MAPTPTMVVYRVALATCDVMSMLDNDSRPAVVLQRLLLTVTCVVVVPLVCDYTAQHYF